MSLQKNLKASFYGQLRLSMQGGAVVHEGTVAHDALSKHKVGPPNFYSLQASSLLPASYSEQEQSLPFKRAGGKPANSHGGRNNSVSAKKPPLPQPQLRAYNTAV